MTPSEEQRVLAELLALAPDAVAAVMPAEHTAWRMLAECYRRPPRAYHHLGHVLEVARHVARHAASFEALDSVYLAVLFHDAVYQPLARDNELLSALQARQVLAPLFDASEVDQVSQLIELTARHGRVTASELSLDQALFLDADMAILGAPLADYQRYAAHIQEEYQALGSDRFRELRAGFLRGLLAQPRIYLTSVFHDERGARARQNLSWELGPQD